MSGPPKVVKPINRTRRYPDPPDGQDDPGRIIREGGFGSRPVFTDALERQAIELFEALEIGLESGAWIAVCAAGFLAAFVIVIGGPILILAWMLRWFAR